MLKKISVGLLVLPLSLFGLKVDCLLKKEDGIYRYVYLNGNQFLEKLELKKVNAPLFSSLKVRKEKGKVLIVWKSPAERFLIVSNNGIFKTLKKPRLVIDGKQTPDVLEIYPLKKGGKMGLPARVELGG